MEYIIEHYFINRTIQVFRFFLFLMLKKIGYPNVCCVTLRSNSLVITEYDTSQDTSPQEYVFLSSFHLRRSNYTER